MNEEYQSFVGNPPEEPEGLSGFLHGTGISFALFALIVVTAIKLVDDRIKSRRKR